MAEVLDDFGHPLTVYPWDDWLDGRPWRLVPGEDFVNTRESFRATAYAAAQRRGGRIRSRLIDGGIIIQFRPHSSSVEPLL